MQLYTQAQFKQLLANRLTVAAARAGQQEEDTTRRLVVKWFTPFAAATWLISELENSHRKFSTGMTNVSQAYDAVHAADRGDTFRLSTEFNSVRERLAYLRDHPDLSSLEPVVLEVAAQMSHVSQELADVYSNERVLRARDFLEQRQFELQQFNERLDQAKLVSTELKHWYHEIELEEAVAAAQLDRLREDLKDVLPELGLETVVRADNTVVELTSKAAE